MKYKIFSAEGISELEKYVEAAIACGWEPVGGVSMVVYGERSWHLYTQAMINKTNA